MVKRVLVAGTAALLLGSGLPVLAKEIGAKAFIKMVNTDADKSVSKDEVEAYAKKKFAEIESDNDKTLDAKELKGRLTAAGMAKADLDKDKTVDEAEFTSYADKLLAEADKNSDGTLTAKELDSPAGKKLRMLLQ